MPRRSSTRAALLVVSAVFAALLAVPAGASASHFSAGGTKSDCSPAPSTACTITVQNQYGYNNAGQTISIVLDAPYTYASAPGIGANNCGTSATPSLVAPSTVHVVMGAATSPCTFTLVEALNFTGAPTTLPCQTFNLTDGSNSPNFTTCATADTVAPARPTIASDPSSPNTSTTPRIKGVAEPFSTVDVYATGDCSGAAVATGSAADYASPGLQVSAPAEATTMFSSKATDAAGNVSTCSPALSYLNDSIAPNSPTVDSVNPSSASNTRQISFQGTAEAGSTVRLFTTSDCSGTPVASGPSGAYFIPGIGVTVPSDGTRTYYATATDAAGNVSACSSSSVSYTLDTVAPGRPVIAGSDPASPADAGRPEIKGTAEAATTVKLYRSDDCSGAVAASGTPADFAGDGITISVPADTTSQITASATDAVGNVSACSAAFSFTEDSTAPIAPTLTAFDPAPPANSNTPRIKGAAEPGSTVRVYTTADCSGQPTAAGGAGSLQAPGLLVSAGSDRTTTFYATTTDAVGHVSPCSTGLGYEEDSSPPAAPTISATDPASPANANAVAVSGGAEPGSTVRIYAGADCSGASLASGASGAFALPGISVTVADDTTTALRATATDAAGNTSACSAPVSYEEDSTAPAAPSVTGSTPASPANDASPRLTGTAADGSTVSIYTAGDCSGAIEGSGSAAAYSGPGLAVSAPADATTVYYAAAKDAAGNTSECSNGFSYTEDSTAPAAPTLTASAPDSPSNDTTPRILGTAETGSTVRLYTSADCTGTIAATGSEGALTDPGLRVTVDADETTTFRATATDAAGNTSACSDTGISYEEDSTAPAAPTFSGTTPDSPSSANSPRVKGTAEAGSTVRLYAGSDCTGTAAATGTAGAFADPGLAVTVASDSDTRFSASSTDPAGNVTCSTTTVRYVEDSTSPAAPTIAGFDPGSPANANQPKVKGDAEAGGTVRVFQSADCTGDVAATGIAAAFADPGLAVTVADDATAPISVTTTDAAGNVSACSRSAAYVEDSTAPAAPVLDRPASPANDNHPRIKGTAEEGSSVRLFASADCTGDTIAAGGAATLAGTGLQVSVADDSQTAFSAIAIDAAGNRSPCSAAVGYTERTTPAPLPPAPAPAGDTVAPTSTIQKVSRGQRRSRRITLRGTADGTGSAVRVVRVSVAREAGTRCRFLRADGTFAPARSCARTTYLTAKGGRAWSLALPKLRKGAYKVRSRAIDAAGNVERKDAARNLLRVSL